MKSLSRSNLDGTIHQETWYDEDRSGRWKKAGEWDRESCGVNKKGGKTSTCPHQNSQVETRIDCSNTTFSGTDVAAIIPSRTGYYNAGPEGYMDSEG
jgi:hypothetical protein